MSLILEALRKLDRDKTSPESRPTVVMMAPLPWGAAAAGSRRVVLVATTVVLATIIVAGGLVLLRGLPGSPPDARPGGQAMPSTPATSSTDGATEERPPATPSDQRRDEDDLPPAFEAPPRPSIAKPPPLVEPSPTPLPSPPSPRFVLSAIGERDGHPIAMINDQIVRVGDRIAGAQVTRIGGTSVDLLLEGRTIHLSI